MLTQQEIYSGREDEWPGRKPSYLGNSIGSRANWIIRAVRVYEGCGTARQRVLLRPKESSDSMFTKRGWRMEINEIDIYYTHDSTFSSAMHGIRCLYSPATRLRSMVCAYPISSDWHTIESSSKAGMFRASIPWSISGTPGLLPILAKILTCSCRRWPAMPRTFSNRPCMATTQPHRKA